VVKLKKIIILLFAMVLLLPIVSADFYKAHEYNTLKAFEMAGPTTLTNMCRDHMKLVIDGNAGTDGPVVHYNSEDQELKESYISTHTKGSGYQACVEVAGSDIEKRCMCVGNALHIIQDAWNHNHKGIVAEKLESNFMHNLYGHMTIEQNYEDILMDILEKENDPLLPEVEYYDTSIGSSFFPEEGGDIKFVEMFDEMSGISMANDFAIIFKGYRGEGFKDTVYGGKKIDLPSWVYYITFFLMGLGLLMVFSGVFRANESLWKWAWIGIGAVFFCSGAVLYLSFDNAGVAGIPSTWEIAQFGVRIPPKFGMLDVSEDEVREYQEDKLASMVYFLKNEDLQFTDASGLSPWTDENGVYHEEGALEEASHRFNYFLGPLLLILFLAGIGFIYYKSFLE
jgi:hypothetical protein